MYIKLLMWLPQWDIDSKWNLKLGGTCWKHKSVGNQRNTTMAQENYDL